MKLGEQIDGKEWGKLLQNMFGNNVDHLQHVDDSLLRESIGTMAPVRSTLLGVPGLRPGQSWHCLVGAWLAARLGCQAASL